MSFFSTIHRKLVCVGLLSLAGSIAAQAQTPFTCKNGVSYVTRNTSSTSSTLPYTLYENNVATGTQTSLGNVRVNGVNVAVNGIGFNEADGFLYGSEYETGNILKIGSDGQATRIAIPGLPVTNFRAGDVAGGYLYLYKVNTPNNKIYKVNLTTFDTETFTLPSNNSYGMEDIVVSTDGKLHGVSDRTATGKSYLLTMTLTSGATLQTGTASIVATQSSFNLAYNGDYNLYTDASGLIYAQTSIAPNVGTLNDPKATYVINSDTTAQPGGLKYVLPAAPTTVMYNADGASCKTATAYDFNKPGFSCQSGIAYLWDQDASALYEINTNGSPKQKLLKAWGDLITGGTTSQYNNMGFNPTDGCLYLYKYGASLLIRIRSDFSIEYITIPSLPPTGPPLTTYVSGYCAGEFDANGVFYLYDTFGQGTKSIVKVDLNAASSTYRTVVGNIPLSQFVGSNDLTINPVDGNLYGVDTQNLLRINPVTGAVCVLGPVGVSDNKVAIFSDPNGLLYFRTGTGTTLYKVRTPVQNIPCGNTNTAVSGATAVLTGLLSDGAGDGARCLLSPFIGETISGSIWNDGNGNHTVDGSESTSTAPTLPAGETLTVYLVNAQNIIVGKADVGSDGKWTMPDVAPGSYTLVLSNDATKNVTQSATGLSTTLPTDWNNTGYNFGGSNTGTGATGSVTVGSTELTNLDFGINKKPVVNNVTADNQPNPGGSTLSPVTFSNPANGYNGSDVEDGTYPATLTGKTVTLTPGTGGDLYYNGVKITTSTTIPNFDPTKVSVDPTDPLAATTVTFTYAVTDAAGVKSDPQTVTVPFAANPLPVTLISFTVRSEGSSAHLYWSTATEENNTGFDIQRSVDLRSWSTVGFVQTQNGTSKTRLDYGFTDVAPRTGMNYYRLRQIDTDGKSSESPVRSVVIEKGMKGLQAYPNPVKDQLTVNGLVGNERIQILDLTGRIVADLTNTSSADTQVIHIRSLSEGSYILNVRAEDGSVISKKLIKTK